MNATSTALRSKLTTSRLGLVLVGVSVTLASSCGPGGSPPEYTWQQVQTEQPAALLSIWGNSAVDIYAVGGDSRDGFGPQALHFDGQHWTRLATQQSTGDLWWVQGIGASVYMAGSGGMILKYDPAAHTFVRQTTPGPQTIFGIWGNSETDIWAVGGYANGAVNGVAGVVWHSDGTTWTNMTLPDGLGATSVLFKVWGSSATDVWAVGDLGATLHWDGTMWQHIAVGQDAMARLFTVHGQGMQRFAVGGISSGLLLESNASTGTWTKVAGTFPQLRGVYAPLTGGAVAVGAEGTVLHRDDMGTWHTAANGPTTDYDFHAVWIDPTGDIWAVGGQLNANPTAHGMIWHYGSMLSDAGPVQIDPGLLACPTTSGTICTWAGTTNAGFNGDMHHRRLSNLYWPNDMEFDNNKVPYVLDWNNHRVRRVNADDTFETVIGTEVPGDGDMGMTDLMPPGALGTTVSLNHPTDIVFEPDNTLTLMAWHNHKIRRWDPTTGLVTVWIGRGPGEAGDGMPVSAMTRVKQPSKFAYDSHHDLYIMDQGNVVVRRVAHGDNTVSLIAGQVGMKGFAGDGGDPLMAKFNVQTGENPEPSGGLAVGPDDKIYIADSDNNRIRVIDLTANTITTIVGTGMQGHSGEGGDALMAELNSPRDIEFYNGDLYIADTDNHCIRKVTMNTTPRVITTVAGVCGTPGFGGDNGPATAALLSRPFGIAFDSVGGMFIMDTYNNVIRRVAQ